MIPDDAPSDIDTVVPPGVTHIGFVGVSLTGQVLLTEPSGHPYGVSATFSKVRLASDERPGVALIRCLHDQVGHVPVSVFPIPSVWATEKSAGFYFAGLVSDYFRTGERWSPHEKIVGVKWCSVSEAEQRISASRKAASRWRDLGLLRAATMLEVSTPRRILIMIQELHQMGFQRLRAAPTVSWEMGAVRPNWYCSVLPTTCISADGATVDRERSQQFGRFLGVNVENYPWSPCHTYGGHQPFGWGDSPWDTPRVLARKFVERFRDVALAGWGPDPEYAHWFIRMLENTAPHGVFFSNRIDEAEQSEVETVFTPDYRRLEPPPSPRTGS